MIRDGLYEELKSLAAQERKITNEILLLMNRIQKERIYLEWGFSSMYEVLVRGLGYSSSAAFRRIEAAKILLSVPEVEEKLEAGQVNLTTLARAQTIMKAQEKATGKRLTTDFKKRVISAIEEKSADEAERSLFQMMPESKSTVNQERRVAVDDETTRHTMNFSKRMSENLKRAKEVLSHKFPNATDAQILGFALEFLLDRTDPLKKVECNRRESTKLKATKASEPKATETKTTEPKATVPKVSAPKVTAAAAAGRVRRNLLKAAEGSCTYRYPATGRICGSRYQLEIDHIRPKAFGGDNRPENLRVLCRAHNLMMADRAFGKPHMGRFRRARNLLPSEAGGSDAKRTQN